MNDMAISTTWLEFIRLMRCAQLWRGCSDGQHRGVQSGGKEHGDDGAKLSLWAAIRDVGAAGMMPLSWRFGIEIISLLRCLHEL
jgi:hypothetical protein